MIVAIVGRAGHGKDTLADMIIEEYSIQHTTQKGAKIERTESFRPFEKARFAEGVKRACAAITGYPISVFYDRESYTNVVKPFDFTVRELMQKVGEGMRKTIHPDIWANTALMRCKHNGNYLFCDTRYPNEIEMIKKVGGKIINIIRHDFVDSSLTSEESKSHSSETALDNYPLNEKSDAIVINNSLEELRAVVKNSLIHSILQWEDNWKLDNPSLNQKIP